MVKYFLKRDWFNPISILFLLIILALAYLPKIHLLGFYRDDWYLLYAGNVLGPQSFYDVFLSDRPFRGFLMSAAFNLFGNNILFYNLFDFFLRSLSTIGFFGIVCLTWPKQKLFAWISAVLFGIYPAFTNLPNALDFQAHIISLTVIIFSIFLSILVIKIKSILLKIILTLAAVSLSFLGYLGMEYYIGMEGLRIFLIWYFCYPKELKKINSRMANLLKLYWPYFLTSMGFLLWRMLFFQNARYSTNIEGMFESYASNLVLRLAHNFSDLMNGLINTSFLAWGVPFYTLTANLRLREWLLAFMVGITASVVTGLFLWLKRNEDYVYDAEKQSPNWARDAFIIGVFSVGTALIPIIFGERAADIPSRFTLPAAMGGVLMLAGVLFSAVSSKTWRNAIFLTLILTAVMTHYANTIRYSEDWQRARQVWWQLSWRAPQLEPGTVLVAQLNGVEIAEDYVLWGPANLIYYPTMPKETLPISAEVLSKPVQEAIMLGEESERVLRSIPLKKEFSKTLVMTTPSQSSCLHVIDGNSPELSSQVDERIARIATFSRIDLIRITDEPRTPPVAIFGSEPDHTWCYYYQSAALARQKKDWQRIVDLGDQALSEKLDSDDWIEWIPFIQAYAYMEDYDAANELASLVRYNHYTRQQACNSYKLVSENIQQQFPYGHKYLIDTFCN